MNVASHGILNVKKKVIVAWDLNVMILDFVKLDSQQLKTHKEFVKVVKLRKINRYLTVV